MESASSSLQNVFITHLNELHPIPSSQTHHCWHCWQQAGQVSVRALRVWARQQREEEGRQGEAVTAVPLQLLLLLLQKGEGRVLSRVLRPLLLTEQRRECHSECIQEGRDRERCLEADDERLLWTLAVQVGSALQGGERVVS